MLYHWNVMDAKTRFLLASHLDVRRDEAAAMKNLSQSPGKSGPNPPTRVYTDKWTGLSRSDQENSSLMPSTSNQKVLTITINNNLSERMQGTFRSREKNPARHGTVSKVLNDFLMGT